MSIAALSPVAPEPLSPMITSVTPTLDPDTPTPSATVSTVPLSLDQEHQSQDGASSPGPGPSRGSLTGGGPHLGRDPSQRSKKPPPLHTGADWKVVLHLPEIETWLRSTSDRVTQLTHSVGQDSDNRHVDVHLVQLKDVCEDISDHVEQIHALLETEFSLKLLSYSVNIIVDIRTVQLLWHQLRVSVLVLKERLLQGLQDSNGNYTRQTDILQAFSQDQHQTRLDALTEVDDCGQLTIRCSQDYFSLDCGITAFELSDYSPSDEPEAQETEQDSEEPPQELDQTQGPEGEGPCLSNHELHNSLPELATPADSTNHNHSPSILPSIPSHSESAKRPLQGVSHSTEVSPTQPSLPKRAALFSDGGTRVEDRRGGLRKVSPLPGLQFQAELSRSTPSLMDPPDRSKFWLELDSVYPENVSQSYESLQVMNGRNLQRNNVSSRQGGRSQGSIQRPLTDPRSPSGVRSPTSAPPPLQAPVSQNEISKQMERTQKETHAHSEGDSDSSLPSPMREQFLSSDLEASGEESDPRPRPGKTAVWIVKRQGQKDAQVSSKASPDREHWYGSEEFLALPAQLRKTEMLAMKLESLAQSIPLRPSGCDSTQDALQDVDDWDLTELNPDWDVGESADNMSSVGESGDDMPSLLPPLLPYRRNLVSRFSSTSSSDIAPSLDESIESGPLSDLQSEEDEGRRSADRRLQLITPPVDMRGGASLVHQLLEDIQNQDNDPAIWKKIECFVQQLDGFISWLQEALDSTENWTQPRQDLDSLRVYLDTHLSFKLNVDSRSALKESVMEEGRALLTVITSHQSGLKDILHMVSSQWDQLQRQIRRQHGWMLRALRCIQARLLYTSQSHEHFAASGDLSANRQAPCSSDGLKAELIPSQCEAQRAALAEQMAIKLRSLHYPSSASRRHYSQLARNNSLQDFEAEYQELWDWLMDMDAMVTDSHQLMMSEEQRHHLFKSSHAELMMMESRKTSLLGRAESLKRSGTELPENFHRRVHNLTHTWRQLEKILSEHSGPSSSSQQNQSANMNSVLVGGRGVAAVENPRSALSPLTNSLLEQLEARIKELKAWLRDTELLIFNSCLGRDKDASEQLQSFKSLCSEVRARRRGVSSVLKLCQKLLQQSQSGPMAEVGPEAEQHREALQLLSINLERRWEAIVMQALQWQNRLKRELGEQQVPGSFLEPGLVDLHQMSPVPAGPVAPPPDDSWEWDETDMTITELEPQQVPQPDLMHNLSSEPNLPSDSILSNGNQSDGIQTGVPANQSPEMMSNMRERSSSEIQPSVISQTLPPNNNNVYQVYSLHSVELYRQPQFPLSSLLHKSKLGKRKQHLLLKSLSKDSSFSSIESLPDLLGGLMSNSRGGDRIVGYQDVESERESGRGSGQSASSRRSESESGIVSDTGELETTANSEIQEEEQGDEEEEEEEKKQRKDETVDGSHLTRHKNTRYNQRTKREESMKEKGWRREDIRGGNREEEKRRRHRRGGAEAVEILINCRGILTPADSDSDFEVGGLGVGSSKPLMSCSDITGFKVDQINGLETPPALSRQASSPVLSQGSSLESLLAPGVELFPCKDQLHRSASLESCLAPCRSAEETGGSLASLGELDLGQSREVDGGEPGKEKNTESVQGEPSSGELSRRTLDLLKRLENIQSPLEAKMTRSVSDMTLRSSSPQRSKLPASPSLGGHHAPLSGVSGSLRKGPPSLINESSATASLTELSSTEDSSLGSEDFAMLRNQRHVFLDPTMAANANSSSRKKRCHGHTRGGQVMDEADAASLSLVVNVSCTSACTDEDEDDSDLLSSSTLTLTEEELGVRDGEDGEEDRLSGASSGNDDDEDDDEEEMEGSYVLGLEYMKRELQSWIRSPRASSCSSSKTEAGLRDELQCGTNLSSTFTSSCQNKEQHSFQNRSKLIETNTNSGNNKREREKKEQEEEEENRRNATRSYISQFVDDVENGNVDQSCLKGKDEDDELLREESSVFTKKGESLRETYVFPKTGETVQDVSDLIVKTESNSTKQLCPSPSCERLPFLSKHASSLVGQLRGELPCHSSSVPSPPSLSPVEDCRSHDALHSSRPATGGRKSITSQEKFKFSSFVTEQTRREVRDKASSLPPRKRHNSHSSCCNHLPSPSNLRPCSVDEGKKENVHDFVMEIIDMTSLALKSKKNQPEELNQTDSSGSKPDQGPASLTQIKDKVLEHSHQPLHLRKGDFYAYLSLSSHDSDCGEVSQCSEEKSSTPAPYSIPTYVTPTQGLHSPSPELFTSTRQQMSNSAPSSRRSSRRSSPGPDSKNSFCTLDLKSVNGEEHTSPSLSLPPSPDIRDEETLFAACTEEVYLGPPLCYSMVLTKKPRRFLLKETLEFLPSLDSGYKQKDSLAYSPCSEPNDSLQEEPGFTPGDSLSYLTPSKELVLDQEQDHLYFQGSSPTEGTQRSFSPLPEPCYSSFSTSSPSNSVSASLQGPGSKPKADNPSSLPPVSSAAEEENRGEDPYLLCDVAGGEVAAAASVSAPQEERSRNEGPPYLNPRARVAPIDSSAAECLADTKALESNMGAVMTKISVCSSATNPSKEAATTATRINPKINCSAMREADREEGERQGEVDTRRVKQEEKGRRGRSGSQQEAKTAAEKQVSSQSAVNHSDRTAQGRSQTSARLPTSRTRTVSRLPVLGAGTSRIQL